MAVTAGTRFGPYEVQSQLGAGGMGEVYRAKDTRLDRIVAIKILAAHLSSSPELKQRMEREARAISALNHPSICHLYDIGSQDGTDFLVMEFLEGETLADRLRKSAMALPGILKTGIAVCEALEAAHRNGIVHRDLKPGNIMLTPSGAKLMDFGLAKPLAVAAASSRAGSAPSFTAVATAIGSSPISPLTSAGTVVGTIQYMSPEQIEGKEADARSDIFALGSVLYEMASGKRPFEGKSQISLASAILEKDPEPISAVKPMTPPALDYTGPDLSAEESRRSLPDCARPEAAIAVDREGKTTRRGQRARCGVAARAKARRLAWALAALAMLIIGAAGGIFLRPAAPVPAIRTVINSPEKTSFNLAGDFAGPPVTLADGRWSHSRRPGQTASPCCGCGP